MDTTLFVRTKRIIPLSSPCFSCSSWYRPWFEKELSRDRASYEHCNMHWSLVRPLDRGHAFPSVGRREDGVNLWMFYIVSVHLLATRNPLVTLDGRSSKPLTKKHVHVQQLPTCLRTGSSTGSWSATHHKATNVFVCVCVCLCLCVCARWKAKDFGWRSEPGLRLRPKAQLCGGF